MNLVGKTSGELLFANFNQDFSCLSVGTRSGFFIYNTSPFSLCFSWLEGSVGTAEMLFCTSLVAFVGSGEQPQMSQRNVVLYNTSNRKVICDLPFDTSVRAVKMNMKRLVVLIERKTFIYDIAHMKLLEVLDDGSNARGVCALTPADGSLLALPTKQPGQVLLYDALNLHPIQYLNAHKSAVVAMAFNVDGTMLATASDQGTVIRVFRVPGGEKLFQFRRGTMSASICSLSFNASSSMFGSPAHLVGQAVGAVGAYLPGRLTDMLEPQRSFAQLHLPQPGLPSLCAITASSTGILVATADGFLYEYALDATRGGDCRMVREHRIGVKPDDEALSAKFLVSSPLAALEGTAAAYFGAAESTAAAAAAAAAAAPAAPAAVSVGGGPGTASGHGPVPTLTASAASQSTRPPLPSALPSPPPPPPPPPLPRPSVPFDVAPVAGPAAPAVPTAADLMLAMSTPSLGASASAGPATGTAAWSAAGVLSAPPPPQASPIPVTLAASGSDGVGAAGIPVVSVSRAGAAAPATAGGGSAAGGGKKASRRKKSQSISPSVAPSSSPDDVADALTGL